VKKSSARKFYHDVLPEQSVGVASMPDFIPIVVMIDTPPLVGGQLRARAVKKVGTGAQRAEKIPQACGGGKSRRRTSSERSQLAPADFFPVGINCVYVR